MAASLLAATTASGCGNNTAEVEHAHDVEAESTEESSEEGAGEPGWTEQGTDDSFSEVYGSPPEDRDDIDVPVPPDDGDNATSEDAVVAPMYGLAPDTVDNSADDPPMAPAYGAPPEGE